MDMFFSITIGVLLTAAVVFAIINRSHGTGFVVRTVWASVTLSVFLTGWLIAFHDVIETLELTATYSNIFLSVCLGLVWVCVITLIISLFTKGKHNNKLFYITLFLVTGVLLALAINGIMAHFGDITQTVIFLPLFYPMLCMLLASLFQGTDTKPGRNKLLIVSGVYLLIILAVIIFSIYNFYQTIGQIIITNPQFALIALILLSFPSVPMLTLLKKKS